MTDRTLWFLGIGIVCSVAFGWTALTVIAVLWLGWEGAERWFPRGGSERR